MEGKRARIGPILCILKNILLLCQRIESYRVSQF